MSILESTRKYVGEQDPDLYGGNVTWPGLFGLPVRGEYRGLLKQDEAENAEIVSDFWCDKFCTWDAESMAKYRKVMDHVTNGQFRIYKSTPWQYVEQHEGWTCWVEWLVMYAQPHSSALTPLPSRFR